MKTLLAIFVAMSCAAMAAGKRGLQPDDFFSVEVPADPQISPDETMVAFTISAIDRKANRRRSEIWLAPIDGSRQPWPITNAESSTSPRWSPDGQSLAFLSARHDSQTGALQRTQIWILPMTGGEPRKITDFKNGLSAFQWSPDGRQFVCVSRTSPSDNFPAGKERSDVRDYTNPAYKLDGSGFFDDRKAHLWIADLSGKTRPLTSGEQSEEADPQWSPDGKRIAYVVTRAGASLMRNSALYAIAPDGGTPEQLSSPEVNIHDLRWSHDGRFLAYISSEDEVSIPKIFVTDVAAHTHRLASRTVTYPADLEWTEDDRTIDFTASTRGEHPFYRLDLKTSETTTLAEHISIRQINASHAAHAIAYVAGDDTTPGDVFVAGSNGEHARALTHLNTKLLADLELSRMERMPIRASDGQSVEGFFMKPAGFAEGRKYPMILMIHGGPNGMWGPTWNIDARAFAGRGWAVLLINPRGSSGYGQAFQRGVDKEWGGKAYSDLMTGVDTALAKYPWVDPSRLGVCGQSFGGFMTDWIVGQTTRFRAAATLSGISDLISVEGVRDAFYGHSRDFGGDLWENFDLYWKYSPIRNAKNVKTPTIVLHGDADQRVPVEQCEEFFRALSYFHVPTEFVIFPREPHSIRAEPKHTVELMKWQIYWFDRYLEGNEKAVKPNAE